MKSLFQKPANLTDNFLLKVLTLCTMYIAQGVTHGFITATLVFHLTEKGLDSEATGGMLALAVWPWAFKAIWGPIIDRFTYLAMGRRRPWIIGAQLMMSATMLLLLFISDLAESVQLVGYIILTHNIFKSIQDVSVDALAVDVVEEKERGKINGFMYGCSYIGALFGTAFTFILKRSNMDVTILVMVAILLLIMLLPLFIRERAGEKLLPWTAGASQLTGENAVVSSTKELFFALFKAFSLRSTVLTAVLAVLIYITINLMVPLYPIFMMNILEFKKEFLANLTMIGIISSMAGSMGGGFIADKLGHKRSIMLGLGGLSVLWVISAFLTPYWMNTTYIYIMSPFPGLLIGLTAASYFSLAMDVSWKKVSGSQFSAYMALMNLSMAIAFKLAPVMEKFCKNLTAGAVGDFLRGLGCFPNDAITPYAIIYMLMALFHLVVVLPLLLIDPHQTRNVLGHEGEEEQSIQ